MNFEAEISEIEFNGEQLDLLMIFGPLSDMEPAVQYLANVDGSFTFHSNVYLDSTEELPATIRDAKHLKEVLQFLGAASQ